MKKRKFITIALLIIPIICLYHYVLYPIVMNLLDFESGSGAWKYEVDVSSFMKKNITKEDSINFHTKVLPRINDLLKLDTGLSSKGFYSLKTKARIADCEVRIIHFNLIHKVENKSKDKILYFLTAEVEENAVANDSVAADYVDEFAQIIIGLVYDYQSKIVKALPLFNESFWGSNKEDVEDPHLMQEMMENYLQHLVVKYHYYYDLPILKINNPTFWDNAFQNSYDGYNNPTLERF